MTEPTSRRSPLSLWQLLLIFLVAQLIGNFAVVALREGAGLPIGGAVGGGVGGFLGVVATLVIAGRRRQSPPK
jgi:hypothetical protein